MADGGAVDGVGDWQRRLRAARRPLIEALAAIPDAAMERPWRWRGRVDELRYALLRLADDEQEVTVEIARALAAAGWAPSEAQRILALAEHSRGELLSQLVGLPAGLLDLPPAADEWPLRRTLGHLISTERRYRQRTAWHVAEARAGRPTYDEPPPGTTGATNEPADEVGDLGALLDRLDEEREAVLAALEACTEADLAAPTTWARYRVDVRFRLHRFAAHERQHTVQVAATLATLGWRPSEAQRLLAQAQATRGQLLALLIGVPDEALAWPLADGQATVAERLVGLLAGETARLAGVQAALAAG